MRYVAVVGCLMGLAMLAILPSASWAGEAMALLTGTSDEELLTGEVRVKDTDMGLWVSVVVEDAPPGLHGFHIHEGDSCEDGGKAAGGHFNPFNAPHGDLLADGFDGAHAGDLGNLEMNTMGDASFEETYWGLTVREGAAAVEGRAVILHANPDDFGQPTGNAGARIACGKLGSTEEPAAAEDD